MAVTTLRTIAEVANVSIATVSLALNNDPRLSQATRERVQKIAKQLNYKPNINAQALKGKGAKTIGVVVSNLTNPFFGEMIHGLFDAAAKDNYNVLLELSNNDLEQENRALDILINNHVAGIIISGILDEREENEIEMIEKISSSGLPIICTDRYLSSNNISYISINQYAAAYDLTTRLINQGHKNIAVVSYLQSCHIITERERGVRHSCLDHKIPFDENDVFYVAKDNATPIGPVVDQILGSEKVYSVIFFICGDLFAIKGIKYLQDAGYSVPDVISIAGFDDIYMSNIITPRLTTIRQPAEMIGKGAFELLLKKIGGDDSVEQIHLPYSIQWRESCCSDSSGVSN